MEQRLKKGDEPLHVGKKSIGKTVGDFWAWTSSDLLNNTLRGSFGEFIVASALGIPLEQPQMAWSPYDLQYGDHKVEVKTSAYLQAWHQNCNSVIEFKIPPTHKWDAKTNQSDSEIKRQADVYVFCVLTCKDKKIVDPLDMNQWEFYVLRTDVLDAHCPTQKNIRLNSLEKLQPQKTNFLQLRETVDRILSENIGNR